MILSVFPIEQNIPDRTQATAASFFHSAIFPLPYLLTVWGLLHWILFESISFYTFYGYDEENYITDTLTSENRK